jgi:site-specific DNA recombinase
LSREAAAADDKPRRLYALVAEGVTNLRDVLKVRLADTRLIAIEQEARSTRFKGNLWPPGSTGPESNGSVHCRARTSRPPTSHSAIPIYDGLMNAVEGDGRVIRLHRSKSTLEQAVIATSQSGKGVPQCCTQMARHAGTVPG